MVYMREYSKQTALTIRDSCEIKQVFRVVARRSSSQANLAPKVLSHV